MKIVAITQARVGSSRLPGKVLKKVGDKTLLGIHIERILKSKKVNELIVATTHEPQATEIVAIADGYKVRAYQGSTDDVLDRFYQAALMAKPDWVIRVTSDCPLIDPEMIDAVVESTIRHGVDYGTNTFDNCFPDGQDVEVFSFSALEKAWKDARLTSEREHVTPYIRKNTDISGGNLFKGYSYNTGSDFAGIRMTVDEQKDFLLTSILVEKLGTEKTWKEYAKYITENDLSKINDDIIRNEGYIKSLRNDK